jgi:hypothetical protein
MYTLARTEPVEGRRVRRVGKGAREEDEEDDDDR